MLTATAKNRGLDAMGITHVAGFLGEPGAGGVEIDRVAIAYDPAAAGSLPSSAAVQLAAAAGETIDFLAYYDDPAAGVLLAVHPNRPAGALTRAFTVDAGTDVITCVGHGLADGQQVVFFNGAAPGGLARGNRYFVISATADTFQVSTTAGGAAEDITGAADAACRLSRVIAETFGQAGTLSVLSSTHTIEDPT